MEDLKLNKEEVEWLIDNLIFNLKDAKATIRAGKALIGAGVVLAEMKEVDLTNDEDYLSAMKQLNKSETECKLVENILTKLHWLKNELIQ